MRTCNILGVKINVTNMDETISYIEKNLESLRGNYICVSNVHTTVMAYENEDYKKIQNSGAMALPDGAPLSILSRKVGFTDAQRVTGPDLMEELFKISQEKGYSHYFYGSTKENLEKLKVSLNTKYPNLNILDIFSPPFRELSIEEDEYIINSINKANPDFIWIGLGAPKQETWMYNHRGRLNGIMIGVGAGFDYHSGKIKRAPSIMQKFSLEWLYRLLQDPKRLFSRYANTNLKFIIYVFRNRKNIN